MGNIKLALASSTLTGMIVSQICMLILFFIFKPSPERLQQVQAEREAHELNHSNYYYSKRGGRGGTGGDYILLSSSST